MKHALMIAIVSAAALQAPAVLASPLSEDDIKRHIVGHRIHLAAPFGGEFPLNYRRSGVVDGNGDALGLGRFVKPADSGRWWVRGGKLCQQFKTWYSGSVLCFDLAWTGERRLQWVRDNGDTGTARIGERVD